MTTKDEDTITHIKSAMTHDHIVFFTNKGKAYQLRAYEIDESSRVSKGTAIVNLLNIEQGEKVESAPGLRRLGSKDWPRSIR